ncbi:putative TIR domain-containing protein [Helianthus annuus]|uniref:Putative toll/interleukin-1 receptor (TIR) domain-containing protein n=1 Tax=Helianthus annuus TaxID=4232 RepID=A0A251UK11_HELAN|nr:putative TIR domain-containing protein [Helianthus annuus]KAJ0917033.1 putative TIR domain-containing protein [Helianthus annuus]
MQWHNGMVKPKVIPVFYHVDPSDLRAQKNDVAVFFQQHEEKFVDEMDKVKEWRDALTATANLCGLHISDCFKVGESTYVRKIVEEILADKPDIQPVGPFSRRITNLNLVIQTY